MRSMLFVPGDSARKLEKSLGTDADAIIVDLEDSVAAGRRDEARIRTAEFLRDHAARSSRGPQLWVRVNPLTSDEFASDVHALVGMQPDGIVLPKTRNGNDVRDADAAIATTLGTGAAIPLLAIATEVPVSVLSLATYVDCCPNLMGLTWGAEDLSAELGATDSRDEDGKLTAPFQLARDLCLMTAAAAGVAPVDSVFTDFRDEAGLAAESAAAVRDGFVAKMAIHPAQVSVINSAFAPSADDVAMARRVVAAFETAETGVASLDGQMLDRPHLARAKRTLARAGDA